MLAKFLRIRSLLLIIVSLSFSQTAQQPSAQEYPVTPNQNQNADKDDKSKTLSSLPESVMNVALRSARGRSFKLADYSGNVVVLNLWATWCGPCRFETPALVRLQREFQTKGVKMIGLSTENSETSRKDVRHWVRVFKVNYRVGWAPPDVSLALMASNTAIPQSLVIGRDGRIVRRFIGFNRDHTPQNVKSAIEEALKQP